MTGYEWREEPDGFRYLYIDYRDADQADRFELLRALAGELSRHPGIRVLADASDVEHDPMWFKAVKDTNPTFVASSLRVAVLCTTRESAARARMLSYLAGVEHCRPFDGPQEALAWLREESAAVRPGH